MKTPLLPLPVDFQPPADAATEPFELTGKFLVVGEGLLALELGGAPLAPGEDEPEAGEAEPEAGEAEPDGCCGAYRKGPENQCPDCPKKGVGFIVAIERALAKR